MNTDEIEGEIVELGMLLACLLDEVESIIPGSSARIHKRSVENVRKLLEERLLPSWKIAYDRLVEGEKLTTELRAKELGKTPSSD
jgi:hypothetical protein